MEILLNTDLGEYRHFNILLFLFFPFQFHNNGLLFRLFVCASGILHTYFRYQKISDPIILSGYNIVINVYLCPTFNDSTLLSMFLLVVNMFGLFFLVVIFLFFGGGGGGSAGFFFFMNLLVGGKLGRAL